MLKKVFIIICFCWLAIGCDYFKSNGEENAVARVNESYLYEEDIESIVPDGTSSQDSTVLVNAYINRWATKLLLMDGALQNLPERKQQEFLKLVEQYKNDLYTKAYLDVLVKSNMDTVVDPKEANKFYEANKESYKLNDDILQFRYLSIPINSIDLDTIRKRFKRFENNDKRFLDSISVQFNSFLLNDSIWVRLGQVTEKVPVLNANNKNQLLKKSNFLQLKDSINLYLIKVNEVKLRNDYAPLEYVNSSIKQIVINKRKLELIKQFEKDITKDAIKNKQFETYD